MSRLPNELYREIVRDPALDSTDYLNICLTTHALAAEAYPLLYHTVRMNDHRRLVNGIETFNNSPRLAGLVQCLDLQIQHSLDSYEQAAEWWKPNCRSLVTAVNNMKNLHCLKLNFLWMLDDPRISSSSKFAEQPPWTTSLSLPRLDCLHMSSPIHFPITSYFKQLPNPLPLFEAHRSVPLKLDHLEGIARIRCHRIRFSEGRVQLQSLRALEMGAMYRRPDWDFAPNLEVMAITSSEIPEELVYLPFLKHVKQFGYLYCHKISPASSSFPISALAYIIRRRLFHIYPTYKS